MRRQIESRPFVVVLCAFAIGLTAVGHPANLLFLLLLLGLCRQPRVWVLACLALLAGVWRAPAPVRQLVSAQYFQGHFEVISWPVQQGADWVANCETPDGRFRGRWPAGLEPLMGDRWEGSGVEAPPSEGSAHDFERGTLRLVRVRLVSGGPGLFRLAQGWHDDFVGFCRRSTPDASWVEALVFGGGDLSREERQSVREARATSFLSASGVHVYVLAGMIAVGTGFFGVPRAAGIFLTLCLLILYVIASGMHIGSVRAVAWFALYSCAYLVRREPDGLSALGASAVGFLAFDPTAIYSEGFQLCVAIVAGFGIVRLGSRRRASDGLVGVVRHGLRTAVRASLIVILVGEPILAFYDGTFSIATGLTSLAVAGVVPAAFCLALLAYGVHGLVPVEGLGIMTMAVVPLVGFVKGAVELVAGLPLGVSLPAFSAYWLALYFLALVLTQRDYGLSD